MTAIYLIRHPETEWNLSERYQGRLEAPLSNEGRRQAALAAGAFAEVSLDAVLSSPLSRASILAGDIGRTAGSPLFLDQRLTEIGLGVWEGLYREEIERYFPGLYNQWYADPAQVVFPQGESVADVHARAVAAVADIMGRWPNGNVAVVTHSNVVQCLVAAALGLDRNRIHAIRVSNCSVTTLCGMESPGSLLSLNATDALFPSPADRAAAQNCVSWRHRRMTA